MISGRPFMLLALCALVSAAGCGDDDDPSGTSSSSSAAREAEVTAINVATLPFAASAPYYVGEAEGFFEDAGLTTEAQAVPSGDAAIASVVSGENQFAFSNIVSVLIARSKGLPLRMVAQGVGAPESVEGYYGIVVPKDSPVRSAADLEGRTIALSTLTADLGPLTVKNVLSDAGVDLDGVKLTEIAFPDMVPALQGDRVDAAVLTEPFLANALAEGMRAVAWPFGETKAGVEISAWVTTDKFIEENPETVEKFQQAIDEANEFSQANPDAVREAILSYTEIPPPVVENMTLPRWSATLDVESVSLIGELANEFGELDEVPSTDDVVQPGA